MTCASDVSANHQTTRACVCVASKGAINKNFPFGVWQSFFFASPAGISLSYSISAHLQSIFFAQTTVSFEAVCVCFFVSFRATV